MVRNFPHVESKHIEQGLTQLSLNCQPKRHRFQINILGKNISADCLLSCLFIWHHLVWLWGLVSAETCVQSWLTIYLSDVGPVCSSRALFGSVVWHFSWTSGQTDECTACQSGCCEYLLLSNVVPLRYHKMEKGAVAELVPKFIWSLESIKWCWIRLYRVLHIQSVLHQL